MVHRNFFRSTSQQRYVGILKCEVIQRPHKIIVPAIDELLDTVPQSHVTEELLEIIAKTPGVLLVHKVRARSAGAHVLTDAHIEVDPNISVTAGHDISERVKQLVLQQLPEVAEITIHVEPFGDTKRHPNHLKGAES